MEYEKHVAAKVPARELRIGDRITRDGYTGDVVEIHSADRLGMVVAICRPRARLILDEKELVEITLEDNG